MVKSANMAFAGTNAAGIEPGAATHGNRISRRLKAWWHGEEFNAGPAGNQEDIGQDPGERPADTAEPEIPQTWGHSTLKTIESIWGDGFIEPGGHKMSRRILGWLAINSKHTVLDLTAGMGGVARSIAETNNLWMDAFETVPELVQRGQQNSVSVGMAKRVPIKHMDLNNPNLPENRYDMIYSRERLFTIQDKPKLIKACATAMKDRGQILITDYMLGSKRTHENVLKVWGAHERETPYLWSLGEYTRALEAAGLSVVNSQDISEDIVSHVVATWNNVLFLVSEGRYTRRQTKPLIQECQLWLDRLNAIERGDLYVGRVHAQYYKN